MAFHRFVTVDGKRIEITGIVASGEQSCDRCGRYMTEWTTANVAAGLLVGALNPVQVELCAACVGDHFPGLCDIATKVMGRE